MAIGFSYCPYLTTNAVLPDGGHQEGHEDGGGVMWSLAGEEHVADGVATVHGGAVGTAAEGRHVGAGEVP